MQTEHGRQYENLVQKLKDSKGIGEEFSMAELETMSGFAESRDQDAIKYYRENLISLYKNPGIKRPFV